MTEKQLKDAIKNGDAATVEPTEQDSPSVQEADELTKMIPIFETLLRPKYYLTSAPTFIPKTLLEQIQFYDTGGVRRLYLYINGSWRYVILT